MIVLSVFAALFAITATALSLSSVMEPYEKQHCFYTTVDNTSSTLSFYYSESVTKLSKAAAGTPPVKLSVFGPSGELVQEHPPKPVLETKVPVTVPGQYSFCLLHSERPIRKVLDVDLSELTPDSRVPGGNVVSPDAGSVGLQDALAQKLERTNQKLRSDLEDLLHTLKYIKNREKRNMETVEEANSRVWWFSLLGCVLVVGTAVLQVTVLKRLFGTGSRPRV